MWFSFCNFNTSLMYKGGGGDNHGQNNVCLVCIGEPMLVRNIFTLD
jgi:hypothetical protein